MVRTIVVNIDSKYRTNYYNSVSTDFMINLNYPLVNVQSIKVSNVQIPNSWNNISEAQKNNYIVVNDGNGGDQKFIIPDGSYTNISLPKAFRSIIATGETQPFSTKYMFDIDKNNALTTIQYTQTGTFTFKLRDDNSDPRDSLGWLMGFRKDSFSNANQYTSKSTFNGVPFRYLYLVIDDFNLNSSELIIGNLENSYVSGNILAIIRINSGNYGVVHTDNYETQTRTYNNPVSINKLHVKLMDPDGNAVDLNYMELSFSLEFTMTE